MEESISLWRYACKWCECKQRRRTVKSWEKLSICFKRKIFIFAMYWTSKWMKVKISPKMLHERHLKWCAFPLPNKSGWIWFLSEKRDMQMQMRYLCRKKYPPCKEWWENFFYPPTKEKKAKKSKVKGPFYWNLRSTKNNAFSGECLRKINFSLEKENFHARGFQGKISPRNSLPHISSWRKKNVEEW